MVTLKAWDFARLAVVTKIGVYDWNSVFDIHIPTSTPSVTQYQEMLVSGL